MKSILEKYEALQKSKNYRSADFNQIHSQISKVINSLTPKTTKDVHAGLIEYFERNIVFCADSQCPIDEINKSAYKHFLLKNTKNSIDKPVVRNSYKRIERLVEQKNINAIVGEDLAKFFLEMPYVTRHHDLVDGMRKILFNMLLQQGNYNATSIMINSWMSKSGSDLPRRVSYLQTKFKVAWGFGDLDQMKSANNFYKFLAKTPEEIIELDRQDLMILYMERNFSEGIKKAQATLKTIPSSDNANYIQFLLALHYLGLKKYSEFLKTFGEVKLGRNLQEIHVRNDNRQILFAKIKYNLASKDYANAAKSCSEAMNITSAKSVYLYLYLVSGCIELPNSPEIVNSLKDYVSSNQTLILKIAKESKYVAVLNDFIQSVMTNKPKKIVDEHRGKLKQMFGEIYFF